ncbi:MAG: hypothetical protein EHM13_04265 [Acidobacteria bacterium]|nr:MAG: hypothetical protein EHM13_04265 [Acidobacteriota bacterium]
MSVARILAGVLLGFVATWFAHALLGGSPAHQLIEVAAVCLIAYGVFSLVVGRIPLGFLVLATSVFLALRAADLYLSPRPLLSGRLSWLVVPAVVAALFLAGERMRGTRP